MAEQVLSESFITNDDAKRYIKRKSNEWDEQINPLINFVVGQAELISGRRLMSRAYTAQLHEGPPPLRRFLDTGHELKFKEFPVTACTAIREVQLDTGLKRTLNLTGSLVLRERRIRVPNDFFWETMSYEVDYTAGFKAGTHDAKIAALRGAGLRWLQVMWQDFENVVGRGVGFSVGGDVVTLIDKPIPEDVRMIFERMGRML